MADSAAKASKDLPAVAAVAPLFGPTSAEPGPGDGNRIFPCVQLRTTYCAAANGKRCARNGRPLVLVRGRIKGPGGSFKWQTGLAGVGPGTVGARARLAAERKGPRPAKLAEAGLGRDPLFVFGRL
jgi:hypothetical protein